MDPYEIDLDALDLDGPAETLVTVKAPVNTATEKQIRFVNSLKADREIPEELLENAREQWAMGAFDKRAASTLIDRLLDCPKKTEDPAWRVAATYQEPEAGVYRMTDGALLRVYLGQQSGKMLVKRILHGKETDGEGVAYIYLGSAARMLPSDALRLTRDEVGSLGIQTGVCFHCGRRLDDPVSVDRGIGPVCWEKY